MMKLLKKNTFLKMKNSFLIKMKLIITIMTSSYHNHLKKQFKMRNVFILIKMNIELEIMNFHSIMMKEKKKTEKV